MAVRVFAGGIAIYSHKMRTLLFLDIQLLADSIKLITGGGHLVNAGAVAAFELFISVSCIAMFFVLRHMNKHFHHLQ